MSDLKDNTDVTARTAKGHCMMGALKELFRSTEVPFDIKYKIHVTIPLNTALWGCESWVMTKADKKTL
jgi:hypothetical protein